MYCQKPSKSADRDIMGMERPPMDMIPPVCGKPLKPDHPIKGFPTMDKPLRK